MKCLGEREKMCNIEFDREAERGAKPGAPAGEPGIAMLKRMNVTHKELRELAFSHIKWKKEMQILDVGCGGGAAVHELLDMSEMCIVHGMDYMEDSIKLASKVNEAELNKRVFLKQGNVQELPYEENSFDLITGFETIYFWPDVPSAVKGLYKALRKDGQLVLVTEASNPDTIGWPSIEGTFRIYRPWEITEYMYNAGFREITVYSGKGQSIAVIGIK